MTNQPQTLPTSTSPVAQLGRRLSTLREQIRTRRAERSPLARQISAYPATRSAATLVLPY
jgi:hypothetical protein